MIVQQHHIRIRRTDRNSVMKNARRGGLRQREMEEQEKKRDSAMRHDDVFYCGNEPTAMPRWALLSRANSG